MHGNGGVTPSVMTRVRNTQHKHSDIKQYQKRGKALRTETTINDARDFAVGRGLAETCTLMTRNAARSWRITWQRPWQRPPGGALPCATSVSWP